MTRTPYTSINVGPLATCDAEQILAAKAKRLRKQRREESRNV